MKSVQRLTWLLCLCASAWAIGCGDDSSTPPPDGSDGPPPDTEPLACADYCADVTATCTDANAQYDDLADCLAYCAGAGWPAGTDGATSGNTLACRVYHTSVAAMAGMADVHCPHTGPSGGNVCGMLSLRAEAATMFVRVDRMGMPAVSTALVSSGMKNAFNDGDPAGDASFAGEFVANLTALHTALDDDLVGAGLAPCGATCASQEYAPGRAVVSLLVPNDVLQINPMGAAGFPNGRRLADPVIDVTLGVILLDLASTTGCAGGPCTAGTLAGLPLNPGANDVAFGTEFPYLGAPHTL